MFLFVKNKDERFHVSCKSPETHTYKVNNNEGEQKEINRA